MPDGRWVPVQKGMKALPPASRPHPAHWLYRIRLRDDPEDADGATREQVGELHRSVHGLRPGRNRLGELPDNLIAWVPDPPVKDAYPIATFTWLLCYKKNSDRRKRKCSATSFCTVSRMPEESEALVPPLADAVATKVKAAVETYNSAGFPAPELPATSGNTREADCRRREEIESCQPTTRFRDRIAHPDATIPRSEPFARDSHGCIAHSVFIV